MDRLKELKPIIYWSRKIAEKLKLPFYTRTQNYCVKYLARVYNDSNFKRDFQIILPLPQETDYQIVTKQPNLEPGSFDFIRDTTYNNVAVLYYGKINPNKYIDLTIDFEVRISPRIIRTYENKEFVAKICEHLYLDKAMSDDLEFYDCDDSKNNDLEIVKCLNNKVIASLEYGNPIPNLYTANQALTLNKIDCGGFDSLLASLLNKNGFKARIVSGFWAGYKENTMHAWLEVLLPNGKLIPLDPSVQQLAQQGRTKKSGDFGFLGSDRIVFSYGCCLPFIINGQKITIDLLQHPYLLSRDSSLHYVSRLDAKRL